MSLHRLVASVNSPALLASLFIRVGWRVRATHAAFARVALPILAHAAFGARVLLVARARAL